MSESPRELDVVILGAGGAGLFCAANSARLGKRVVVFDHAPVLGRKILISGGGRCNFTNIGAKPECYYSQNAHFAKSAMARFSPSQFLELIHKHDIPYYEKKLGQLFCKDSAQRIVNLLAEECKEYGAEVLLDSQIHKVQNLTEGGFLVETSRGSVKTQNLVVATGGLSIPKIGATDFGYRIAEQFGLEITRLDPALVSLTMDQQFQNAYRDISGVSLEAELRVGGKSFVENILFTHSGLSGPAILQASLYWFLGEAIQIKILPQLDWEKFLLEQKKNSVKRSLKNVVGEKTTERFAEAFLAEFSADSPVNQMADQLLRSVARKLSSWELKPVGTGGYSKAEVTRGGVNTEELSSRTLEAKKVPGLFFIGEVVDVTGMLGGYNFQWAWASAFACAETIGNR